MNEKLMYCPNCNYGKTHKINDIARGCANCKTTFILDGFQILRK